jgi:N-acetylglucosamine malate deacetylase 1
MRGASRLQVTWEPELADSWQVNLFRRILNKLNPYRHREYIREVLALRSRRGPYRFLVRSWEGLSDIDLAVSVLKTEFFRHEMKPVALPVESVRSILVLAPHQDDEAIGSGGSLLLAGRAGVKLNVLYVTDGAQLKPGIGEQTRQQEAKEVCSRLGAGVLELGISNLAPQPTLAEVDRLCSVIQEVKPDVVMAPWLLDWPAKHRFVNHLLWLAHKRSKLPEFEVWGYQVHNTPFSNGYVEITSVADEKRGLLECYQSQNEFNRYDHMAMGMGAWNAHMLESSPLPRYVEVFLALPGLEFFRLLESSYFRDFRATYRGDQNVCKGILEVHRAVMGRSSMIGGATGFSFGLRDVFY